MTTPSEKREADEKIPGKAGALGKYKWWLIGGLGAIAVIVFLIVRHQSSSSTTGTSSLAAMGIDPATGVPYAQEYANAYGGGMGMSPFGGGYGGFGGFGGGMTGPAGPQGKTGPRGPRGPGGKDKDKDKEPKPGGHQRHGHTKGGSRTEAMSAALASRRAWNTRIVPGPNKSTHMV